MNDWADLEDYLLTQFAAEPADDATGMSFADGGAVGDIPEFIPDDQVPNFIPDDSSPDQAPAAAAAAPAPEQAARDFIPDSEVPQFISDEALGTGTGPQAMSGFGTGVTEAAKAVLPTIGSLPAIGAGMEAGALLGAPAGPIGVAAGAIAGGAAGALGAGYLLHSAQQYVLDNFGPEFLSSNQAAANVREHPYWATAGSIAGALPSFGVGGGASIAQRALGGGVFAGLEAGQEYAQSGHVDPTRLAIAAAGGAILNKPRTFAEGMINRGAAAVQSRVPGRPDLKPTIEAGAAKAAADANDLTTTSQGTAAENSPVNTSVEQLIGNPGSAPVRSERQYGKGAESTEASPVLQAMDMAPDMRAALGEALGKQSIEAQRRTPQKSQVQEPEKFPVDTGLETAVNQAPDLQQVPPRAQATEQPQAKPVEQPTEYDAKLDAEFPKAPEGMKTEPLVREFIPDAEVPPEPRVATPEELAKAPGETYPHPELDGITIDRTSMVPHVTDASPDGAIIRVDSRVPDTIDVNGKALDPAVPLSIRESVKQAAIRHGKADSPAAQRSLRKLADDMGAQAERGWLESRGYDYDAYRKNLQDALTAKEGAAEPVTAAVKQPAVVEKALAELEARGMTKARDAILADPEKAPQRARMALEMLSNRSGEVKAAEYATARVPSKPAEVEGLGVTARSKADAERKGTAYKATVSAFEKFAPDKDIMPTSKAEIAALKKRLEDAIAHARKENGGGDPLATYKPREKPPSYKWLRAAQKLVKGRMTQKQIAEFIADEKQLRSGNPEDAANVGATARIEADIARRRRPTVEQAELGAALEHPWESGPAAPHPAEIAAAKRAEEGGAAAEADPLARLANVQAEQEKISQNLIAAESKAEEAVPQWQKNEQATEAQMAQQRRAREAAEAVQRTAGEAPKTAEGAASEVRKVAITDDIAKKALEAMKVAEERNKSRSAPEAKPAERDGSAVPKVKDLTDFFKDQKGELNIERVRTTYKAKKGMVQKALTEYFGVPITDMQRRADAVLAWGVSQRAKLKSEAVHLLDARWHQWNKMSSKEEAMTYMKVLETVDANDSATFKNMLEARGIPTEKASWMADEAPLHRQMLDEIFKTDEQFGSKAAYRDNYLPHLFKDESGAKKFIDERIRVMGSNWYQKERFFDLIEEAERAGFKIKYDNPIDLITARWMASISSNMLTATLRKMEDHAVAFPTKSMPDYAKAWDYKFTNAGDGQQWIMHPEAVPLFENALIAKGIATRSDAIGSVYRGWMMLKNVWVPIQLSLSAFHALHIVGINLSQNLTTATRVGLAQGGLAKELWNAGKLSAEQSIFILPLDKIKIGGLGQKLDELAGGRFSTSPGRAGSAGRLIMEAEHIPRDQQTPDQRLVSDLLREMGVTPHQPMQEIIGAKRAWSQAMARGEYVRAIPVGIRRGIEKMQEPLFKYYIPALKAQAALRSASAAIKMDPELLVNTVKREQVMREIGKNVDDRYGEMFYDSLFWNKYLKDIGIGSMLSLSWNLGQVRQLYGAVSNVTKMVTKKPGSRLDAYRLASSDKAAFVANYVATSMAIGGLISYALSGEVPKGLDYTFPRNGYKNPDGTPARVGTPFNTREVPMLLGHVNEYNSWIGGATALLWNKMILSPIVEAVTNRDFYGNRLYDVNAPWYKRSFQIVDATLGGHINPITISGAQRSLEMGGGARDVALSFAGFGPAAKYISHTPMESRISHLFYAEGTSDVKPYEYGKKTGLGRGMFQDTIRAMVGDKLPSEARQEARGKINRGNATGDRKLVQEGQIEMVKEGGMSPQTVLGMRADQEYQYKFSRLPEATQRELFKQMTEEEKKEFVYRNPKLHLKQRWLITKP